VAWGHMAPADQDYRKGVGLDSKEWKRFRQNQDPRLHFLRDVPASDDANEQGLPELAIDFRQCFSLATAEAYFVLETAHRRCRLQQPYAEHLSNRFSWHISRIALPLDHHLPLEEGRAPGAKAVIPPAITAAVLPAVGEAGLEPKPVPAAAPSDGVAAAAQPVGSPIGDSTAHEQSPEAAPQNGAGPEVPEP